MQRGILERMRSGQPRLAASLRTAAGRGFPTLPQSPTGLRRRRSCSVVARMVSQVGRDTVQSSALRQPERFAAEVDEVGQGRFCAQQPGSRRCRPLRWRALTRHLAASGLRPVGRTATRHDTLGCTARPTSGDAGISCCVFVRRTAHVLALRPGMRAAAQPTQNRSGGKQGRATSERRHRPPRA